MAKYYISQSDINVLWVFCFIFVFLLSDMAVSLTGKMKRLSNLYQTLYDEVPEGLLLRRIKW